MNNKQQLQMLHRQINECQRCPLFKTAVHAVPGEGAVDAQIMFVGEAPGRNEDETGRPFVGRAGKLLTELIESLGVKRKDVFITSVIKHRPPKNRAPKTPEVVACRHWLDKQLAIIKPQLIVPLGRFGMEYFLPDATITTVHGTLIRQNKWYLFPVYHPAYGLRGTRALQALKADFVQLKKVVKELQ